MLSSTLTYTLAALMIGVGVAFIVFILRTGPSRRPQGGLQWIGVTLSALLILLSGAIVYMTAAIEPASPTPAVRPPAADEAALNQPAPNFRFRLVADDAEQQLDAYAGRVVLLNFWATWCPPCLEEMPALNELQDAYADEGLVVLTVSDEPREQLLRFAERLPMNTVSAYLDDPAGLPAPFDAMRDGRPVTYLIDRDGYIREFVLGARDLAYFEALLEPYLEDRFAAR